MRTINILGHVYQLTFVDEYPPEEFIPNYWGHDDSQWYNIDYRTNEITIYRGDRVYDDVHHTLTYIILNEIINELRLEPLKDDPYTRQRLSIGLSNVLIQNSPLADTL